MRFELASLSMSGQQTRLRRRARLRGGGGLETDYEPRRPVVGLEADYEPTRRATRRPSRRLPWSPYVVVLAQTKRLASTLQAHLACL
jgi:hypothetical protein